MIGTGIDEGQAFLLITMLIICGIVCTIRIWENKDD